MIPRAGAGHVEQVALGIIYFLQIRIVADRLDALLQRNYLVVAGHHDHSPKLQSLGEVHGADRNVPACSFNVLIENLENACHFALANVKQTVWKRREGVLMDQGAQMFTPAYLTLERYGG
jgi:hypothetical protein